MKSIRRSVKEFSMVNYGDGLVHLSLILLLMLVIVQTLHYFNLLPSELYNAVHLKFLQYPYNLASKSEVFLLSISADIPKNTHVELFINGRYITNLTDDAYELYLEKGDVLEISALTIDSGEISIYPVKGNMPRNWPERLVINNKIYRFAPAY